MQMWCASGVCFSRSQPAASASSSSVASGPTFSCNGKVRRPQLSRAVWINRRQMEAFGRSMATTWAPRAIKMGNGPMAEPAPKSTKVTSERSIHSGVSDTLPRKATQGYARLHGRKGKISKA